MGLNRPSSTWFPWPPQRPLLCNVQDRLSICGVKATRFSIRSHRPQPDRAAAAVSSAPMWEGLRLPHAVLLDVLDETLKGGDRLPEFCIEQRHRALERDFSLDTSDELLRVLTIPTHIVR